ncbi:MAG: hypothetical protein HOO06_15245 [Bdellovibrionaceae bacterium]|nr:hypothetical protein [Pseudobdellovibrionaceae bacterium]
MNKKVLILVLACATYLSSFAGDFEWSGLYRFEANHIENSELDSSKNNFKDYGLHHLILKPKIVAADGLTIFGRFDIMNSGNYFHGQLFGGANRTISTSNIEETDSVGNNMGTDSLLISQLYAELSHEFGLLKVGRAPLHFGLGLNLNAGAGDFDHYSDTRDLLSYEIAMGNYSFITTVGKVVENTIEKNTDDVNEYIFNLNYDNSDAKLKMGVLYQMRRAAGGIKDVPFGTGKVGGAGATRPASSEKFEFNNISIYFERTEETHRWALETAFIDGKTGILDASDNNVGLKSYLIGFEFDYLPTASDFKYGFKFGSVSGDNPNTTNTYEGAAFDANYDVAMLLFNHQLGSSDILNSTIYGGGAGTTNVQLDVERVTNTTYLSPNISYQWRERWNLGASFTLANLNQVNVSGSDMSKSLGSELDLALTYKPNDNLTWVNTVGYLMAGEAFKGSTTDNFNNDSAIGYMSKIAIRF